MPDLKVLRGIKARLAPRERKASKERQDSKASKVRLERQARRV